MICLRATSNDSRLWMPGAAALRHLVELTESPYEGETFTQEFRLVLSAVAEYGHCGLAAGETLNCD